MPQKDIKGITVKKAEDLSEWYTQVIQKADLIDYSAVSGCIVYKPNSYLLWEKIVQETDQRFKQVGIKNSYFPLFIPESFLRKESQHVEHFAPEVAWVTYGGNTKLGERLAVRPTSETIMYDSYSKWIRSYNDLPLRLNQWNNVVRWEFKHPTPFIRGREFLWNEGHTCFATEKEALQEQDQILKIYREICDDYLALPALIGRKSEKEKFAGAVFTVSMEFIMPNGKGIQGPDFHHDGQNFAKVFDITFVDQNERKQYVWQNTFAISTRMLGILIAVHGDDKGLVLPPRIAPIPIVIVPIYSKDSQSKIIKEAQKVQKTLSRTGILVHLDDRDGYSPGWKFNEWEVKGVPLRIEIGPKDLEKKQVILVRRDSGEKQAVPISAVTKKISLLLNQIQDSLFKKAAQMLKSSIVKVSTLAEAKRQLEDKKVLFAPWCNSVNCEEKFKADTGAKSLNSPLSQPKITGSCFACKKKAQAWFYFGKSY